jgi:hypothetical protein
MSNTPILAINIRRGIALNGVRSAVIDSYLSNFREVSAT